MTLHEISPERAKRLLDDGAILVDIREANEHARERIPGALLLPLSQLDTAEIDLRKGKPVLFHCKSGMRTKSNARRLAAKAGAGREAFIVGGGINAWKRAGLPVAGDGGAQSDRGHRVRIGLMSVAIAGSILGLVVSPFFFAIPVLAGAGLLVAGLTGNSGKAGA